MINKQQVLDAQQSWGNGVVMIGKEAISASDFVTKHYSNEVMMKPTMAKIEAFRTNHRDITSYFVGGNIAEDNGFALKPWTNVRFENAKITVGEKQAFAVGHYFFTDGKGEDTKVEYSFGYVLENGELKINLHHSSLP